MMEEYTPEYYEATHRNWFAHPNFALFRWIEHQLPAETRSVLDVGCGRGDFLKFLRRQRQAVRLVGVDLSRNDSQEGIEFLQGDVLNLETNGFDVVTSLATIEHILDINTFVRRILDMCNSGGMIIVMTLDEDSLLYRVARLGRRIGIPLAFDRLYSAHHVNHFTRRSLVRLLEKHGMTIKKILSHNAPWRAIDIPVRHPMVRQVVFLGLAALLGIGRLIGLGYLQTVVATVPAAGEATVKCEGSEA
jgi:2-polyprenyl-3-methyl-5-hydroxy-6-metoxy-1,4-benzoquinol methylase